MATAQVLVQTEDDTTATSHVSIGQNLADALKHLRRQSETRMFWADAICINQKDLAERSQQVLLMGVIHGLASGVVAFLGPEAGGSSAALDLIEKTGSLVDRKFGRGELPVRTGPPKPWEGMGFFRSGSRPDTPNAQTPRTDSTDFLASTLNATALVSWVSDWSTPIDTADIHDFTPELFHLGPSFTYIDSTVIHATGAHISRVACVIYFDKGKMYSGSDADTAVYLRTLFLTLAENQYSQTTNLIQRQHFWEACCRTLWFNNFSERWVPPVLMNSIVSQTRASISNAVGTPVHLAHFTEDGHLGAAAESVSVGGQVTVLSDSFTPVVLRPDSLAIKQYRVLSACYLDRGMHGESHLGDLPTKLHGVLNGKGSRMLWGAAYMDVYTRVIYQDDPRNEPFRLGLHKRGFLAESSLVELKPAGAWDVLSRAGFPVQTFELI
ncbi:hypothetical protein J7T55_011354 [Diaporthe amygdali]|uniref:uncharacterized protein n=1 Tax=Phomopsis amygdali TaxID=1214568 RepID=UPI0022FF04CD|nr:uncharacterized protein J7T55_011354 [Diaporthe amygdali]KAJ0108860.1 hypothetical protein J7T55_011354 [Diaporthe amygdali]